MNIIQVPKYNNSVKNKTCVVCGSEAFAHYNGIPYCRKHYHQIRRGGIKERTNRDANELIDMGNFMKVVLYDRTGAKLQQFGLIDKNDLKFIDGKRIGQSKYGDKNYCYINVNGSPILLHRYIWLKNNGKIPSGMVVDHINGNPMDNRKQNLRLASALENSYNLGKKDKYTGVNKLGENRYAARIMHDRKDYHLGTFPTLREALDRRLEAEKNYFGKFGPNISRGGYSELVNYAYNPLFPGSLVTNGYPTVYNNNDYYHRHWFGNGNAALIRGRFGSLYNRNVVDEILTGEGDYEDFGLFGAARKFGTGVANRFIYDPMYANIFRRGVENAFYAKTGRLMRPNEIWNAYGISRSTLEEDPRPAEMIKNGALAAEDIAMWVPGVGLVATPARAALLGTKAVAKKYTPILTKKILKTLGSAAAKTPGAVKSPLKLGRALSEMQLEGYLQSEIERNLGVATYNIKKIGERDPRMLAYWAAKKAVKDLFNKSNWGNITNPSEAKEARERFVQNYGIDPTNENYEEIDKIVYDAIFSSDSDPGDDALKLASGSENEYNELKNENNNKRGLRITYGDLKFSSQNSADFLMKNGFGTVPIHFKDGVPVFDENAWLRAHGYFPMYDSFSGTFEKIGKWGQEHPIILNNLFPGNVGGNIPDGGQVRTYTDRDQKALVKTNYKKANEDLLKAFNDKIFTEGDVKRYNILANGGSHIDAFDLDGSFREKFEINEKGVFRKGVKYSGINDKGVIRMVPNGAFEDTDFRKLSDEELKGLYLLLGSQEPGSNEEDFIKKYVETSKRIQKQIEDEWSRRHSGEQNAAKVNEGAKYTAPGIPKPPTKSDKNTALNAIAAAGEKGTSDEKLRAQLERETPNVVANLISGSGKIEVPNSGVPTETSSAFHGKNNTTSQTVGQISGNSSHTYNNPTEINSTSQVENNTAPQIVEQTSGNSSNTSNNTNGSISPALGIGGLALAGLYLYDQNKKKKKYDDDDDDDEEE